MSYSSKETLKTRQKVTIGTKTATGTLDGTTTIEYISFSHPVSKLSVQSTGNLAGTIEMSINGVDWFTSTPFVAITPVSYSAHNISAVKVTRTSGTGTLVVSATP
jgi:hypothetical protein